MLKPASCPAMKYVFIATNSAKGIDFYQRTY